MDKVRPRRHRAATATRLPPRTEHVAVVLSTEGAAEVEAGDICEVADYGKLPVALALPLRDAWICILGAPLGRWLFNARSLEAYALGNREELSRLLPELQGVADWTPENIESALEPLRGAHIRALEPNGTEHNVKLDVISRVEIATDRCAVGFSCCLPEREGF